MTRLNVRDFGTALSFNGTSDKVSIGTAISPTTAITYSAWIKPSTPKANQRVISLFSHSSIRLDTNGRVAFVIFGVVEYFSTSRLNPNSWYHIAATYDRTSVKVYVNGVLESTTAETRAFPSTTSAGWVGTYDGATQFFKGIIDQPCIHSNRALTAAEVSELYYNGLTRGSALSSGLVGEWLFNEGSGSVATDSSGSGNNGAITGATYSADVPMRSRVKVRDFGTALGFVGSSTNVVSVPNFTFSQTSFTVSFWTKAKRPMASNETIMRQVGSFVFQRQGVNDLQVYAYLNAPNNYATPRRLRFRDFVFPNQNTNNSASHFASRWEMQTLVIYVDNGTAKCDQYINGTKAGSTHTVDYTGDTTIPSGDLFIGNSSATTQAYNGLLDDVMIWNNRALSASEVSELYYNGLTRGSALATGLVGEWLFNEGSGSTAYDTSGSGNHGTITGATYTTDVPMVARGERT